MKKSPFQTRIPKVSGLSPFKDETDTELTVDKEAISNVENYYNKLLTSDIHKGRARNMYGGADAQSILDTRINRLRTAKYENVSQEDWDAVVKKAEEQIAEAKRTGDYSKIVQNMKKDPYMPVQSKYDRKTGTITASGPQAEDQGWDIESIIANEMSHHLGSLTSRSVTNTPYNIGRITYGKGDYAMSLGETALIDESFKEGKGGGYRVGDRDHDQRNHEVKSDIDTLRYELYKLGIYDATSEDFTQEHLNKAREIYKDDPKKLSRIDALEDNFEDDKLINLMNKLVMEQNEDDDPNRDMHASNEGQNTPMSMRINPKTGL